LIALISAPPGDGSAFGDAVGAGELRRFEFTQAQMGLPFRIVVYAPTMPIAAAAVRATYEQVARLNMVFSDYETESEVSRLSRSSGQGRAVSVSQDLWQVLWNAKRWEKETAGALDVTVGPYVGLWRKARREGKLPDKYYLDKARGSVGGDKWRLEEVDRTVELTAPRMWLDLGGIAKGYVLDQALQVMTGQGLDRVLLQAGGDIFCGSPPPGKMGWRIEVPGDDGQDELMIQIQNRALATSGDYYQFVEIDGVRYSHIIHPQTGLGLSNRIQVSVVASNAMTADALATSLCVLGPERGVQLVRGQQDVGYRMIFQGAGKKSNFTSEGFQKWVIATGQEK